MPARDANRGRGGGQGGGAGNRSGASGGRHGSAAASASSPRSSSTVSGGGRGVEAAGGSSGRATRKGATSESAAGAPRAAGQATSTARTASSAAGTSSGVAGGDLAFGGIGATGASAAAGPSGGDIDTTASGSVPITEGGRTTDRERNLESARESPDITSAAAVGSGGAQPATRVAGRGQTSAGPSAWVAADNPFAMMRRMEEDLDRVFRVFGMPRLGTAFAPPRALEELLARTPSFSQPAQWSPQLEVFERDGSLVVHADLPGVRREDVEVNVEGDVLTISGERRQETRNAEGGYVRTERSYGTFFRQIPLPDGVDPAQVQASYQDGVLEVVVPPPRDQQRNRRRVDIR